MSFAPEKVDFLFRLIFDRSEKKVGPGIVTTNTDGKEWWSFFPSQAMGMAFSDRILGGAVGIKFTGPSIRSKTCKGATKAKEQAKDIAWSRKTASTSKSSRQNRRGDFFMFDSPPPQGMK